MIVPLALSLWRDPVRAFETWPGAIAVQLGARGANGNDAGGRLVRHCRCRGSIERRKKTSQETPQIFRSVIDRED